MNSYPRQNNDYEELLSLPELPGFIMWVGQTSKRYWLLVGSPVVGVLFAIGAWLFPNPSVVAIFKFLLILPVLATLAILVGYGFVIRRHYQDIRKRHARLRKTILAAAGLDVAGDSRADLRFAIQGIADHEGTVQLVLGETASVLRSEVLLTVVSTNTLEEWGTVKVLGTVEGLARAAPVDRLHPKFWEMLEDRMKTDPSPPEGFHLEPYGLRKLHELLKG